MRSILWQYSSLLLIFLMVIMIEKVDWEWQVELPNQETPTQCTEIVLSPPARNEGYLRKQPKPETQPASPLQGAQANLYLVTGYAIGDGYTPREITADGRKVRPGITAACRLPLGTMIYIEGIGPRVCEDHGTGPPGVENWIDIAFETPEEASAFGRQWLAVVVIR